MTELSFSQQPGGAYTATFTASGRTAIQIVRSESGYLRIRASVSSSLPKASVLSLPAIRTQDNMLVNVDVPNGAEVEVVSETPVTQAACLPYQATSLSEPEPEPTEAAMAASALQAENEASEVQPSEPSQQLNTTQS